MVSLSGAAAALVAKPLPHDLDWSQLARERSQALVAEGEPSAGNQIWRAVRLNALVAAQELLPGPKCSYPLFGIASSACFAAAAPFGPAQIAALEGALWLGLTALAGSWPESAARGQLTPASAPWSLGIAGYAALRLQKYGYHLDEASWAVAAEAAFVAAAALGALCVAARVCKDALYAIGAAPLAAAVFVVGIAVDICTIAYYAWQGSTATQEQYLFARRRPPLQGSGKIRYVAPDATLRSPRWGQFPSFCAAPVVHVEKEVTTHFARAKQPLLMAQKNAQERARLLDREVALFLRLADCLNKDAQMQQVFGKYIDGAGYAAYIIDLLDCAGSPEYMHLFNNRPNISRGLLPRIRAIESSWKERSIKWAAVKSRQSVLHVRSIVNDKLFVMRGLMQIFSADDYRLRFVSESLLRAKNKQEFEEDCKESYRRSWSQPSAARRSNQNPTHPDALIGLTQDYPKIAWLMRQLAACNRCNSTALANLYSKLAQHRQEDIPYSVGELTNNLQHNRVGSAGLEKLRHLWRKMSAPCKTHRHSLRHFKKEMLLRVHPDSISKSGAWQLPKNDEVDVKSDERMCLIEWCNRLTPLVLELNRVCEEAQIERLQA